MRNSIYDTLDYLLMSKSQNIFRPANSGIPYLAGRFLGGAKDGYIWAQALNFRPAITEFPKMEGRFPSHQ